MFSSPFQGFLFVHWLFSCPPPSVLYPQCPRMPSLTPLPVMLSRSLQYCLSSPSSRSWIRPFREEAAYPTPPSPRTSSPLLCGAKFVYPFLSGQDEASSLHLRSKTSEKQVLPSVTERLSDSLLYFSRQLKTSIYFEGPPVEGERTRHRPFPFLQANSSIPSSPFSLVSFPSGRQSQFGGEQLLPPPFLKSPRLLRSFCWTEGSIYLSSLSSFHAETCLLADLGTPPLSRVNISFVDDTEFFF